jgi:hypothetical protein
MKNLVGLSFAIAEARYRIVDVRRLGSDALVYAEQVSADHRPVSARTAFHYRDIAPLLATPPRPEPLASGAS